VLPIITSQWLRLPACHSSVHLSLPRTDRFIGLRTCSTLYHRYSFPAGASLAYVSSVQLPSRYGGRPTHIFAPASVGLRQTTWRPPWLPQPRTSRQHNRVRARRRIGHRWTRQLARPLRVTRHSYTIFRSASAKGATLVRIPPTTLSRIMAATQIPKPVRPYRAARQIRNKLNERERMHQGQQRDIS
jgi:hypothetical protein